HNGNNPSTLDFGVLKNFSSGDATSLNELCSDHNPVSFEIDINANIPAITKTLKTTNWMKFYDITKEAIPGNPSINSTKDIDEVINKITAVILTAINQSSKAKIINGPHRKLPPRITNKITLRNQIKKRWQITYDPRFKRKSTQLTNEIKADINQYDQDSWTEWLLSLNQEDLSIYNATRKYSRKFHKIPPILDTDGLKYTPLGKANAFKYSLENSFQTNPEPYDNRHISEVNRAVQHFLNSMRNDNNIKLTSPLEIQAIIKKINPKKATGPDGIPNKALKMIPPNLLTCITKVFNKCLLHHYFPPSWKIAHVLMFPKPGQNHKLPGNYRPISLLSNLGKIYEKVILARLKEHCSDLQIIPDEQYGFRPNHGCVHQLLRVTNLITHGFNNKLYTGGVFLDVRKAFDRMWHNGLIYKLIANKLPHYLIDIIILFLLNRTFKVKLNSTLSETGHIKAGTPQGSILSPLLYTVYTADFPVNNHITNCFFADDTAILAQGSTTKFVIRTLQRGLIEIEKWCTLWRVAINTDKTRSVMFRKGHPRNNLQSLTFFEEELSWDKEVKYLGLILDSKLTFHSHIKYNTDKFWAKVHVIIPLIGRKSPLSLNNKVLLFKQILRPILTYASQIWGLAAKTHLKKVQIMQNKILRIMTNAPWYIRNDVIHKDLKLESAENHIQVLSRKFFQQITRNTNPTILEQLNFTNNNGKYPFPYATTKWTLPLKPP
ncbi:putative RNA-directed DNA polymerase from transposon X-element, partial [Araneus ventricosus]